MKPFFVIIIFYFLAILQTSFFSHFGVLGGIFNPIFIIVILVNFIEKSEGFFGIFLAIIGGLFLDVFSAGFIGRNVLILLGLSLIIKFTLRRYVRAPI